MLAGQTGAAAQVQRSSQVLAHNHHDVWSGNAGPSGTTGVGVPNLE